MLIIIGIAGAAALSVIAYNIYKNSRPDLVSLSTSRAQQLAAVVLVFSRAVEDVVEARNYGLRSEPVTRAQGRLLIDARDEEGWR